MFPISEFCHALDDRPLSLYSFGPPESSLIGWFDQQINRMQHDLMRHRYFDIPEVARATAELNPSRRSRLFDAMFSTAADDAMVPEFRTNTQKNQIECQLGTGCGDFFRPEDVEVNVKGRSVELKARREQKSECGNSYALREVRRVVTVPDTADIAKLHAEMAPNGKLLITAPLLKPALEDKKDATKPVPIKINRS